ncbi:malonyl-CoA-acyl carrier protein transacylase beg [Brevipalpus obovatus]|uniref:malonyl-CoA-acyl carrier protein transacylase beg n=1 Tax=Brevipalpus obovatus TaxID=246614 RepID=UPI003D9DEF09
MSLTMCRALRNGSISLRSSSLPMIRYCTGSVSVPDERKRQKPIMSKLRKEQLPMRPMGVDPSLTSVILFPGQGAQFVGMAEDLIEVPNVEGLFESAKRILGYDLLELCINGPPELLNETVRAQPAVFVTSLAAIEKLRVQYPGVVEACVATAGYSEGEIAALVFAGAFSFEDGLRLVKIRAEAVQRASELTPGGMMTIMFGADARINFACAAATEWCLKKGVDKEKAICSIAGYLFPHCKIVAGHEEALKFLELSGHEFGIRKTVRLNVSGAFHTHLMNPARLRVRDVVERLPFGELYLPVHSNLDCRLYRYEDQVRKSIPTSLIKPVKWEQILQNIYRRPKDMSMPKTFILGNSESLMTILMNVNMPAFKSATLVSV